MLKCSPFFSRSLSFSVDLEALFFLVLCIVSGFLEEKKKKIDINGMGKDRNAKLENLRAERKHSSTAINKEIIEI